MFVGTRALKHLDLSKNNNLRIKSLNVFKPLKYLEHLDTSLIRKLSGFGTFEMLHLKKLIVEDTQVSILIFFTIQNTCQKRFKTTRMF